MCDVPSNAGRAPLASWDCESGQWLDASGMSGDLFGQSEPFSGRWPVSGSMRNGVSSLPLRRGHRTGASGYSSPPGLLPTPRTADGLNETMEVTRSRLDGGARWRGTIEEAVSLLPTPNASDVKGAGQPPGRVRDGRERPASDADLPTAVSLLRTPTSQLATNGGSQHPDKRKAGGHGPTLADEVEHLLPTPAARDWKSGQSNIMDRNARPLNEVVEMTLLPTPNATDSQGGPRALPERRTSRGKDHGPRLRDVAPVLLPTPCVADAEGTRATRGGGPIRRATADGDSAAGINPAADPDCDGLSRVQERDLGQGQGGSVGASRRVDPHGRVLDWGPYELAIRRWEHATGRPAPRPTEPGRTGERLSPAFVEWMMGLPEGWVTDVPGLSRNAQLKALGNGVVPAQAAMALRILLDRADIPALVITEEVA
jgi:hypothetical protein